MLFKEYFTLLILLLVTLSCQGFEFTIERKEYLIKNRTYCCLLQCQVDTISDTNIERLTKIDIYYSKDKQLLASILAGNSKLQVHTRNNAIVIGSMSKDHGEIHAYFSDPSECSDISFICKIHFKNKTNGKDMVEKVLLPTYSDQSEEDIYVKSHIYIEHEILDKSGAIMKKLKSNTSLSNKCFSIVFENRDLMNSNEILTNQLKSRTVAGENTENNFEQKLTDLKNRKQHELFLIEMSSKLENIKWTPKEINAKIKEIMEQDLIGKFEQSMSAIIQSQIDTKFSSLERRTDELIEKINASFNVHQLNKHPGGLEIIQKLDLLVAAHKLMRSKVSNIEIQVKEVLENDRQMNYTMKELHQNVNDINDILKSEEVNEEIKQSLPLLHNKLTDSKLLNVDVKMGEVVREMQYMKLTMNDLKQSVNDKCNGDGLGNKTGQILSTPVENSEELNTIQGSNETLLVNEKTTLNNYNTPGDNHLQGQLKCESGMSSEQGSRVITSLDNGKQVLCDTETDGGGWIVIQRRVKGDVNFTRNWNDYKYGFGSFDGDFWIGNEIISLLTTEENYTSRIDMREGTDTYYANYDNFMVTDESENYKLRLGGFNGNIEDSLIYQNNLAFTTPDRDNDIWDDNCAQSWKSGWWYSNCHHSHLNGVWGSRDDTGIVWYSFAKHRYLFLDYVEMKIRRT